MTEERVPDYFSRTWCSRISILNDLPAEISEIIKNHTDDVCVRCHFCHNLIEPKKYRKHLECEHSTGFTFFGHSNFQLKHEVGNGRWANGIGHNRAERLILVDEAAHIDPEFFNNTMVPLLQHNLYSPDIAFGTKTVKANYQGPPSVYDCDACGKSIPLNTKNSHKPGGVSGKKGNFCDKRCANARKKRR